MARQYTIPLLFDSLFNGEGKHLDTCSEKDSIQQNIELLLMTCPGEHYFNPDWGCRIWEIDFERVVSRENWEKKFVAYIEDCILRFEARIKGLEVNIQVDDIVMEEKALQTTSIRKKVLVHLTGQMISTGENCDFIYTIYLGPLTKE